MNNDSYFVHVVVTPGVLMSVFWHDVHLALHLPPEAEILVGKFNNARQSKRKAWASSLDWAGYVYSLLFSVSLWLVAVTHS